jgi:hypothetical protein
MWKEVIVADLPSWAILIMTFYEVLYLRMRRHEDVAGMK